MTPAVMASMAKRIAILLNMSCLVGPDRSGDRIPFLSSSRATSQKSHNGTYETFRYPSTFPG